MDDGESDCSHAVLDAGAPEHHSQRAADDECIFRALVSRHPGRLGAWMKLRPPVCPCSSTEACALHCPSAQGLDRVIVCPTMHYIRPSLLLFSSYKATCMAINISMNTSAYVPSQRAAREPMPTQLDLTPPPAEPITPATDACTTVAPPTRLHRMRIERPGSCPRACGCTDVVPCALDKLSSENEVFLDACCGR